MPSAQIEARFNTIKANMIVQVTADGVPPSAASGTNLTLLIKDAANGTLNQQQMYGYYRKAINYVRDNNVLNDIAAGVYDGNNHLLVSLTRDGAVTAQATTGNIYTPAPVDSISIAIPVQAGWAKESATLELDNISKRLWEKLTEDFLKAA